MPSVSFYRFPFPNLTTYSVISTALFVSFIYNAKQITSTPGWKNDLMLAGKNASDIIIDEDEEHLIDLYSFHLPESIKDVLFYMIQDSFSRWIFINAITCAVVLCGKVIQRIVFADLRTIEIHNFREKLCNYFLYKCIFMFGVIKVQTTADVIFLLGWFGVLGFLQIFVQFSKDRLEYMVTVSSHITFWSRCKIVTLLLSIFSIANYMIYLCLTYGVNLGYNIFAFMIAELAALPSLKLNHVLQKFGYLYDMAHIFLIQICLSITLRVPHILIKYVIDPFEAKFIRNQNQRFRGQNSFANFIINKMEMSLTYYVSLGLELADLCLELLHYLHMVLWSNALLSVATFALCMHVRYLTTEIQRKIKKHRNYIWILNYMEKEYPMASEKELSENSDNCAICWEKMEVARKLPCRHLFHTTCLQLWLEQDTSCPTCRYVLNMNGSNTRRSANNRQPRGMPRIDRAMNRQHFFHFDGSRYVSWLPSFSVQVMSGIGVPELNNVQLEEMAHQVQQIFPLYPTNVLMESLRQTRSVSVTSNNILEGLLPIENESVNIGAESPQLERTVNEPPEVSSSTSRPVPLSEAERSNGTSNTNFNIIESQFSPSPAEREAALTNRKEQLFLSAKKKFLERNDQRLVN